MTTVVLLLLVVGWLAYIAYRLLERREILPHESVHSFNQQLSVLEALDRASAVRTGRYPQQNMARRAVGPVPDPFRLPRREARLRRRDIFFFLVAATLLTGLLAVLLGGVALFAALMSGTALLVYVTLLARKQKLAMERSAKVRYLPSQGPAEPAFYLQRTGTR